MADNNTGLLFMGGLALGALGVFLFSRNRRTQAGPTPYQPGPNSTFHCNTVLQRGNEGPLVRAVQESLLFLGFDIGTPTPDGILGPGTEQAIIDFQSSRGITADGILGPNTYRELNEALQEQGGSFICTQI